MSFFRAGEFHEGEKTSARIGIEGLAGVMHMNEERHFRIRLLAYELWQEAGCPHGQHLRFWLHAERLEADDQKEQELQEGLEETFPASDTPTSLMRRPTGTECIPENGGGPRVSLKKAATGDRPKPTGPATDVVDKMDAAIEEHRSQRKK